jgi:hypothetical protein
MKHNSMQAFDEANALWFHDGYVLKAIAKYQEALRHRSDDPVIVFQLASVLCAVGDSTQARPHLAVLETMRGRLGETGLYLLDRLLERCQEQAGLAAERGIRAEDLDIEQLQGRGLSNREWLRLALLAEDLEAYGVAVRARALGAGGYDDPEDLRDEEGLHVDIRLRLRLLGSMRKELRT